MSDAPPGEPPDRTPFPEPPPAKHGFAALPLGTRIVVIGAAVLVLALIGYVLWQAAQGDEEVATIEDVLEELADEEQSATTTIFPPVTSAAARTSSTTLVEVAVATTDATGTASTTTSTTATAAPTTTTSTSSTTTTTTVAPTTTLVRTATTTTSTVAPTTTSNTSTSTTTTVARTTTPAPTTVAPPTTTPAPTRTTTAPPTTPAPTTAPPPPSTAPTLPVAPGEIARSARLFAESWNANAAGTDVPALTESQITALENGPAATTFIAPFSDQVGLVGVVRNDDRSVAEVLLVWIPGDEDAASNQLYRDAFDVLLRTVNPGRTAEDRAQVGSDLGLTAQAPPFPTAETVTAEAFPDRYSRFVRDTTVSEDTAIISVVDARPR